MNYYFEFADNIVGEGYHAMGWRTIPHKYCVRFGTPGLKPLMPSQLSSCAERIWAEDEDGKVSFVKNRYGPQYYPDMKEFVWVKLSAVAV